MSRVQCARTNSQLMIYDHFSGTFNKIKSFQGGQSNNNRYLSHIYQEFIYTNSISELS